jgi:hypothetical protein
MKKIILVALCRLVGHPTIRKPVEIPVAVHGREAAGRLIDVPCRRCGRVRLRIVQPPELTIAA